MKKYLGAMVLILNLVSNNQSYAGKVAVVPGNSLGLSGITIPQNISSAPSPATASISSPTIAPSVTLPTSVITLLPAEGSETSSQGSESTKGISINPTTQQLVTALSEGTDVSAFTVSQAATAINKISSIINNADLTTEQTAALIQLRESFETFISEAGAN